MNISHLFLISLLTAVGAMTAQDAEPKKKGPERWDGDMKKFIARDKATPPPEGAVLFVGSSSIRMWDLKKSWPKLKPINNGFGGSTLADSIYHFDKHIAPYNSLKGIVIYAGDNDIGKGLSIEETVADFKTLHKKIRKTHGDVPVIFIAIKPSGKRWELWPQMKDANDKIAAIADKTKNLYFADIAAPMLKTEDGKPMPGWFKEDQLHLNDAGYEAWTAVIKPLLETAGAYQ